MTEQQYRQTRKPVWTTNSSTCVLPSILQEKDSRNLGPKDPFSRVPGVQHWWWEGWVGQAEDLQRPVNVREGRSCAKKSPFASIEDYAAGPNLFQNPPQAEPRPECHVITVQLLHVLSPLFLPPQCWCLWQHFSTSCLQTNFSFKVHFPDKLHSPSQFSTPCLICEMTELA